MPEPTACAILPPVPPRDAPPPPPAPSPKRREPRRPERGEPDLVHALLATFRLAAVLLAVGLS
jgi:hypothetical protein